jgi:hypothetical protein
LLINDLLTIRNASGTTERTIPREEYGDCLKRYFGLDIDTGDLFQRSG